jgi:hypothetical protein
MRHRHSPQRSLLLLLLRLHYREQRLWAQLHAQL